MVTSLHKNTMDDNERYVTRASELRSVMLPVHREELESILSAIREHRADMADWHDLHKLVESYDIFRQLPPPLEKDFTFHYEQRRLQITGRAMGYAERGRVETTQEQMVR